MIITLIGMVLPIIYIIYYFAFDVPKKDKIAFKLYELRDEVAMEVINGNLEEDTLEYAFMITLINIQIGFLDREIPYTQMVASAFRESDEEQVNSVFDKIRENEKLREIYVEVMSIYKNTFRYKKYIIKYMYVVPVSKFIGLLIRILTRKKTINFQIKKREKRELCRYREDVNKSYGIMEKLMSSCNML